MSQALFERATNARHEARSAGTEPAERIHPVVVEAMREVGIDIGVKIPQALTPDLVEWPDVVVTMGCGDACPVVPGKRYIDWDLRDPAQLPLEQVRVIRDEIERRVTKLAKTL
jgi:arsenate reductase